jgi:uncharacterized protein (TIGR00255 family)
MASQDKKSPDKEKHSPAVDSAPSSSPKSMTGFARVVLNTPTCELEVELKSVNHRFFEVATRLPRIYNEFERSIKAVLQRDHRRGRIDLSVTRRGVTSQINESNGDEKDTPKSNDILFETSLDRAVERFKCACQRYGVGGDLLGKFLIEAVVAYRNQEEDVVVDASLEEGHLLEAVGAASKMLVAMREKEGAYLIEEISQRMRTVEVYRTMIQEAASDLPQRAQKRLNDRIQQLLQEFPVDSARIGLEVALIAERSDITEELTRLDSHFQQFRSTLVGSPEGIGRKLDFLMQEFGREFNTITSKAQDARIQGIVVDAKADLEKIREQIQNIE